MKAKFHQVPKQTNTTFSIRHDVLPHFGTIWHYHPEIELHYLIKGEGLRFIGENITDFNQDELILLGSNIPHMWKCNNKLDSDGFVEAIVVHFHPDSLGKDFLGIPEAKEVRNFLQIAKQGLLITGETKDKAKKLMLKMKSEVGINKIVILLRIFELLSKSKEYEIISSSYINENFQKLDEKRINNIFTYTFNNFKRKILIEELAEISNLSVTSFCRFFKTATKKSYFEFLTEIRLNYACRELLNTNKPIKMIAEESGFENQSNFYRHFKNYIQISPLEYKIKNNIPS
ncbi:AraC family transcriptional regulator [Sphingobacterium mizutaii NBRC 14946 = DSM 11724]|uniref:Melibiose operon regulatory protein n=2 Tax=Sphingobacterium mizutaii TaxID=1010 RepID=A0AAJ4XAP4_9SPHI|nr:helix-turn-helix domain-containing protein [Sphingobacterium mizutaii]GEM67884.1 AraC family transcriptional regulator [Sphingobacterium mizutaii NBRC 14946 = DSM 11724]SDK95145.1 AraC-type DNA-binding protein [Sphingobacterium mizutaii]SNV48703.1 Melibiose operon regulatory protein [Sphingobacterium mizutaii]